MPLAGFHPTIQRWFAARFDEPTEPQREGWHTLISADPLNFQGILTPEKRVASTAKQEVLIG